MKSYDFADIKSQSQFCTELLLRLNEDIQDSGAGYGSGMKDYTRKQDDIKRIRRELMTLSRMLNPWER